MRNGWLSVPHIVLLRVNSTAIQAVPDRQDRGSYYVLKPIPAAHLEIFLHNAWTRLTIVSVATIDSITNGNWDDPILDDADEE